LSQWVNELKWELSRTFSLHNFFWGAFHMGKVMGAWRRNADKMLVLGWHFSEAF
jgi:hypothetical protein